MDGFRTVSTARNGTTGVALLALLFLLAGCDGKPPTAPNDPESPSPASNPQPRFLTIDCGSGACQLDVGSERTLSVFVVYSDGSRRPEHGVWTTENPTVATVDQIGNVRGISSGATTIKATFGALTAGMYVRVMPRLFGSWKGHSVQQSCKVTGDFDLKQWCTDFYTPGDRSSFGMTLREENGRLSGWMSIDDSVGLLTLDDDGSLEGDGRMQISARGELYGGWAGPYLAIVSPLQAQMRDALLEGSFVLTVVGEPGSGISGSVVVEARLEGVTRR